MSKFEELKNKFMQNLSKEYKNSKLHPWFEYLQKNSDDIGRNKRATFNTFLNYTRHDAISDYITNFQSFFESKFSLDKIQYETDEELKKIILNIYNDEDEMVNLISQNHRGREKVLLMEKDKESYDLLQLFYYIFAQIRDNCVQYIKNPTFFILKDLRNYLDKNLKSKIYDLITESDLNKEINFVDSSGTTTFVDISKILDVLLNLNLVSFIPKQGDVKIFQFLNRENYPNITSSQMI
jgi:hypothetical protein